jgi:hypothetical protein
VHAFLPCYFGLNMFSHISSEKFLTSLPFPWITMCVA